MQTILTLYDEKKIESIPTAMLILNGNRPRKSNDAWNRIGSKFVALVKKYEDEKALFTLCFSFLDDSKNKISKKVISNDCIGTIQPAFVVDAINLACELHLGYACDALYNYYYDFIGTQESRKYALEKLDEMVEKEYSEAESALGRHHVTDESGDFVLGIKLLDKAIEAGDLHACYQMACLLTEDVRITKDIKRAAKLLDIKDMNVPMKNQLAYIYVVEWDDDTMRERGISLWKETWEEKSNLGGMNYALMLLDSSNTAECELGKRILSSLAGDDIVYALSAIGDFYWHGTKGFKTDLRKAQKYLKQAADNGGAEEKLDYARFLLLQNSQTQQTIYSYLQQAAEDGNSEAMFILGNEQLEGGKLKINISDGVKWLGMSSERGNLEAKAYLGKYYIFGSYVEQNITKGIEMLRFAAEKDCIEAIVIIASMQTNGYAFFSKAEIEKWLVHADENGSEIAPYYLHIYKNEYGIQDLSYIRRSKDRGYIIARVLYDYITITTNVDNKQLMEAIEDLKSIGKEEKSGYAARILYDIYSGDSGIPPNKGLAREYLEYAVSCGDEDAMFILESMYSKEHGKARELKELRNTIANKFARKSFIYFTHAGHHAYECKDFVSASEWFIKGVRAGQIMCGNNLACMIRRGEADEIKLSVDAMVLLKNVVAKATSSYDLALANLNIALNKLLGCACERNELASFDILKELARNLELFQSIAEWWLNLAKYGDQEGCLVALILYSFGANLEKKNVNINECYEVAKSYSLPDWIRIPTSCSQVSM